MSKYYWEPVVAPNAIDDYGWMITKRMGPACDQSVALRLGNAKGHAETTCLHCDDAGDTTGTAINWSKNSFRSN